jgi:peptidoglycan hydrolase CwlO-like protein
MKRRRKEMKKILVFIILVFSFQVSNDGIFTYMKAQSANSEAREANEKASISAKNSEYANNKISELDKKLNAQNEKIDELNNKLNTLIELMSKKSKKH